MIGLIVQMAADWDYNSKQEHSLFNKSWIKVCVASNLVIFAYGMAGNTDSSYEELEARSEKRMSKVFRYLLS